MSGKKQDGQTVVEASSVISQVKTAGPQGTNLASSKADAEELEAI